MFPTFYTDIYTDIITATLPPLPPTFLPQEKIFAKNPPTLLIYNKVGREREGGKKRGKERFFTKKKDFANFCWDYIKEYWKKGLYLQHKNKK